MSRAWAFFFGALSMVGLLGCGARAARPWHGESMEVPDEAHAYSTDAKIEDAASYPGTSQLAADVTAELAKRGQKAVADGALNATARWLLREANQQRTVGPLSADAASRHFGFPGVIHSIAVFDIEQSQTWRDALAHIPDNMQLNRFGVSVSPAGRSAAVVFGGVALAFRPVSRFFEPGATIRLQGEVDRQFAFAHVYLTKPDGTVDERQTPSRAFDYAAPLPVPGKYKLEVMGDGATGPVVVANIPLFVGVLERPLTESIGNTSSPAEAEARLLQLLNQTRAAAKLRPVEKDEELRKVALAHSSDMADHKFFSHVSPSTGTTEDRVTRAGLLVTEVGENLSLAPSPELAHEGLMDSPGHRAVMLGPAYTHVGIAVVQTDRGLITTLLFGRRPDPAKVPRDAAQVEAALFALRVGKGLSRPAIDPVYRAAALQGVRAYLRASKPTAELAAQATSDAIRSEVAKLRTPRAAGTACTFLLELTEVEQLERNTILLAPGLVKFGLGAQMHTDDKGTRLATMFVLEGACETHRAAASAPIRH